MSSWEGIRSSHGNDILGLAGQQYGAAFSAAPTITNWYRKGSVLRQKGVGELK